MRGFHQGQSSDARKQAVYSDAVRPIHLISNVHNRGSPYVHGEGRAPVLRASLSTVVLGRSSSWISSLASENDETEYKCTAPLVDPRSNGHSGATWKSVPPRGLGFKVIL